MKIGICIRGNYLLEDLRNAVAMGFDTVELYFNDQLGDIDWKETSRQMAEIIGDSGVTISGIGEDCGIS